MTKKILYAAAAIALGVACKPTSFTGGGKQGIYKTGDKRDDGNGEKEDLLRNSAFTDDAVAGGEQLGGSVPTGTDTAGAGGVPETGADLGDTAAPDSSIDVLRVCSNNYTQEAQSNLRLAEAGIVASLVPADGQRAEGYHFHDPALAQRLRGDAMNLGRLTLPLQRVAGGSYQLLVCDARFAASCQSATPAQGVTRRFGGAPGLLATGLVKVERGRAAAVTGAFVRDQAAIELLTDRNIEQDAMMQTFFGTFAQAAAQDGGGGAMPVFAQADLRGIENCDESASPLIIDFGNTGVGLSAPFPGVAFDIDADGEADRISWPLPEAGRAGSRSMFLVLDRDENGLIDGGGELFGNHTAGKPGEPAPVHGFAALARLDSDRSGAIDGKDEAWSRLRLWSDDGDGVSAAAELLPLAAMDVVAIDLAFVAADERDPFGNTTRQRSVVRLEGGAQRMIVDIWFRKL
jgi:hypothetical protein